MSDDDYGGMSLFDLFAQETDAQARLLADGLLSLERHPDDAGVLESCMRAAHSLKGAARIVGVAPGVAVAHVMEECFVLAQRHEITLLSADIDVLLSAVDVLRSIADAGEAAQAPAMMDEVVVALEKVVARGQDRRFTAPAFEDFPPISMDLNVDLTSDIAPELRLDLIGEIVEETPSTADYRDGVEEESASDASALPDRADSGSASAAPERPSFDETPSQPVDEPSAAISKPVEAPLAPPSTRPVQAAPPATSPVATVSPASVGAPEASGNIDRTLRVAAENLDRLLALSGQAVVEARTLRPFTESLTAVLHRQRDLGLTLQRLRSRLIDEAVAEPLRLAFDEATRLMEDGADQLAERLGVLETFDRRHLGLANQLYEAALASRMRPFGDITGAYPRMVREVARTLGKQVQLSVVGETTQVDRDILSLLDAPLGHLLRNAIDHGIEAPAQRLENGKPAEGKIQIEARHVAGTLVIEINDDGGGIDVEAVRAVVVRRGLVKEVVAERLSEAELLEFLMLPGFSMREQVTEVSGRGVGLDVVQTTIRQVRGSMRITQQYGIGTRFRLQLPLTLSVMRCLLADVGGEPYAFPLAHIRRALRVQEEHIETVEGRPHFTLDGQAVALVLASQLFRSVAPPASDAGVSVIVFSDADETYGLIVDRFHDERMLVVQPLDPRLGKVADVAAASLMEDGSPVLIADVEDLMRSMARLASAARVEVVARVSTDAVRVRRKRVLVVDDSLTVRELQRKLLTNGGYDVSVAVDGMEGWNALMAERFDMVVTDVDMPRIDGIELVTMIRRDPEFRSLPVMIVSYKDRPADRQRGLDAGADHYLAKSSFHDAALLDAVRDLIGDAGE